MPIFEYRCGECAHLEEVLQKHTDPAPSDCPRCRKAGTMSKELSLSSFQLKGGGWYKDLYSSSKAEAAGSDSSAASAGSSAGETPTSSGASSGTTTAASSSGATSGASAGASSTGSPSSGSSTTSSPSSSSSSSAAA